MSGIEKSTAQETAQLKKEHDDVVFVITTSAELEEQMETLRNQISQLSEEVGQEYKSITQLLSADKQMEEELLNINCPIKEHEKKEKERLLSSQKQLGKWRDDSGKLQINFERVLQIPKELTSRMTKKMN